MLFIEVDTFDLRRGTMQKDTGILVKARSFTESLIALLWKVVELPSLPKPSPLLPMRNIWGISVYQRSLLRRDSDLKAIF